MNSTMSNAGRIAGVVTLCLIAPLAWFRFHGLFSPCAVVLPGVAVWLIAQSPWSRRTRIAAIVVVVVVTIVLPIGFYALLWYAFTHGGD